MLVRLNEAWEVLGNPESRANYDYFWEIERKKREIIQFIKFLIEQKKYEEARAILIRFDHPIAQKCLIQIDRILADQRARQAAYVPNEPAYAGAYGSPSRRARQSDVDDLAERRIQEIERREAQRNSTQQQEQHRKERERQQVQAYRNVLIRTYQRVGAYAFQWEDLEAEEMESVPKNKMKAWDAIEIKRYEVARRQIAKSPNADQNMRDWSLLIDYILETEKAGEKLKRLGLKGFLGFPLRLLGVQWSVLTWLMFVTSVTLALNYLAPTVEVFIVINVVALFVFFGMLIRFVSQR